MREPYTQLYLHLVWATWDRLPLLGPELQRPVYACILDECRLLGCEPIRIGGIEDHVHLLLRFPTTLTIAQVAKQVKGSSSHLVTHRLRREEGFKWQGGYGAFTVARSDVPRIARYIDRQAERHRDQDLDPELERIYEMDWPENGRPPGSMPGG